MTDQEVLLRELEAQRDVAEAGQLAATRKAEAHGG